MGKTISRPKYVRGKHGMSRTKIYAIWHRMICRCHLPTADSFEHYGGRGIYVCPEWIMSFDIFFKDMGHRPDKHSLERIDNDGPYAKWNCCWATKSNQNRNKRYRWKVIFIKGGKKQVFRNMTEAAKATGFHRSTIWDHCHGNAKQPFFFKEKQV